MTDTVPLSSLILPSDSRASNPVQEDAVSHDATLRAALQQRPTSQPIQHQSIEQQDPTGHLTNRDQYGSRLNGRRIRLVRLERVELTEPIRVRLIETDLDNAPTYLTLSYVWGDPKDPLEILCDDKPLAVTRNLHAALRQLSEPETASKLDYPDPGETGTQGLLIWIDSICINQSDTQEKTEQVRLMFEIYSKAYGVTCWLGDGSPAIAAGASFCIERINHAIDIEQRHRLSPNFVEAMRGLTSQDLEPVIPERKSEIWDGIVEILSKPWFTRIWIIQEFVASKRCTFLCGDTLFDGRKFLFAVRAFFQYPHFREHILYGRTPQDLTSNLHALTDLRPDMADATTLIQTLYRTRDFRATDLRDKIFAVAHFSSETPKDLVDYQLSHGDLFRRVVDIMLSHHSPDILSTLWPLRGQYGVPNAPSPQWQYAEGYLVPLNTPDKKILSSGLHHFWEEDNVCILQSFY